MDHGAHVVERDGAVAVDAENVILPLVPFPRAGDEIPVPRAHLAGGERETAPLLALHQPRIGGLELRGALRDAPLQLGVEALELAGLAIKLGEHLHLGAQHRRHDRHRHVVHRAHLVAAQPIDVGHLDGGDEDDRGPLEARVIADQRGELETVKLRHADVDQDDRGVVLEQKLQRLARGRRLDEVLAEIAQDFLVGEEFPGLIVHQAGR